MINKIAARILRVCKYTIATVILSITVPQKNASVVVTLNPLEDNAAVMAVQASLKPDIDLVTVISPEPNLTKQNISICAGELRVTPDFKKFKFLQSSYRNLLKYYTLSQVTYTTHFVLPGTDLSGRRRHVNLTHGSGPKKEICFKSPCTVLHSITPHYISEQKREYHMRNDAMVLETLPRLSLVDANGYSKVLLTHLGFSTEGKYVVYAPTYRISKKWGSSDRNNGVTLSRSIYQSTLREIIDSFEAKGYTFLIKSHHEDVESFRGLNVPVIDSRDLLDANISNYGFFAAMDYILTDYSSIYEDMKFSRRNVATFIYDYEEFNKGYRGFRGNYKKPQGLEDLNFRTKFFEELNNPR